MPETQTPSSLESYLHLLDEYTTQQASLQAHLRTSFLSLSKAHFHAGTGFSPRFGPDWFDGRARAALRVRLVDDGTGDSGETGGVLGSGDALGSGTGRAADGDHASVEMVRRPYSVRKGQKSTAATETATTTTEADAGITEGLLDKVGRELAGLNLTAETAGEGKGRSGEKGDGKEEEEEEEVITNPLFQFGMLVPQALRTAQDGFVNCVEDMVRLVDVERRMRRLEALIEREKK